MTDLGTWTRRSASSGSSGGRERVEVDLTKVSPTGACYVCGARVSGDRKLCGLCAAKR